MSRTITTIDATDGRIVTDLTWRDLTNPYLATSLQTAVAARADQRARWNLAHNPALCAEAQALLTVDVDDDVRHALACGPANSATQAMPCRRRRMVRSTRKPSATTTSTRSAMTWSRASR